MTLPRLEREILICHAHQITRAELYAHPEKYQEPKDLIERRLKHEPIAFITGYQPFLGLDMFVTPDVLIPRPETEHMVEYFLNTPHLPCLPAGRNAGYCKAIADIGTGSGCIAVSLAIHLPKATIYAIDSSEKALEVAKANAKKHGVSDRIRFLKGHLFEPLKEKVDLVISNPPYIPTPDIATLMPDVRDYEPISALDGGPDGLDYIREIIEHCPADLLLEFGFGQAQKIRELAGKKFKGVKIQKDQFDLDRYLLGYKT